MQTVGLATSSARRSGFLGGNVFPRAISKPSAFAYAPTFAQVQLGPNLFTTSLDPSSLKPSTAQARYVDAAAPNNASTGLDPALPKQALWSAIGVGGNDTIYIKGSTDPTNPTLYEDNMKNWSSNPVQSCCFVVVSNFTTLAPGYAITSTSMPAGGASGRLGTWALTADAAGPHVYEATLLAAHAPNAVIDATVLNAVGAPTALTARASIALVEANPGSYWHDSAGGKIYVRAVDSRAPDTKVRVLRDQQTNGLVNSNVSLYVERLTFEGGNQRAFYGQRYAAATFVDCAFWHSSRQGMELNSSTAGVTQSTYLIRCRALSNAGDGFGATASGAATVVQWLEWDCEAAGNSGASSDEGSSVHKSVGNGAVTSIRVGGSYHGNKTDGIADVGGMQSWVVGSHIYSEAGTSGFYCGDASTAWLHGVTLTGNAADIATDNAGGTVNVDGSTIYATTAGAGTVARYTP